MRYTLRVLERATPPKRVPWYQANAFGLGALGVGFASLIAAFVMQFGGEREITEVPDMRITIPLLIMAVGVGVTALVRREPWRAMAIAGMGMAGAALALGWMIVAAAVALGAVVAILIIAKFT